MSTKKKQIYSLSFLKLMEKADEETKLKLAYIGYLRVEEMLKILLTEAADLQKKEKQ